MDVIIETVKSKIDSISCRKLSQRRKGWLLFAAMIQCLVFVVIGFGAHAMVTGKGCSMAKVMETAAGGKSEAFNKMVVCAWKTSSELQESEATTPNAGIDNHKEAANSLSIEFEISRVEKL